jgi:hypothetical protein
MCKKTVYSISFLFVFSTIFQSIVIGADPNLIGWWKLDDGSGTVAIDSSVNRINGTINGNPSWGANSPFDQSNYLLFDGTNDWVDINSIPQGAFLLPNYTISLYFRLDGGTDERNMFSATNNAGGHGIMLSLNRTNPGRLRYINRAPFGTGGTGDQEQILTSASGTLYNDGQWHHLAAVRASDTSRLLYVDGVQVGSNTMAVSAFTEPARVVLGTLRFDSLGRWWNGGIDDVRIYNRALSSADVLILATSASPQAHTPNPETGATNVKTKPTLTWKPGRLAKTHNVYWGTNSSDVNSATTAVYLNVTLATVDVNSYVPETLQLDTTYYWRVDEVNNAHPDKLWKGSVWSFTTGKFLTVDDMESYGTANTPGPPPPSGSSIWFTWKDGAGWTVPSVVQGNGTGSGVDPNNGIVHGGNQSLKFFYRNDGVNPITYESGKKFYSEITADTSYLAIGRDWTKAGVKALTLWFYGRPENTVGATEQMYVKLNNAKVLYDGDMNNIKQASWHEWNIDLVKFGIPLTNISTIAIGFGNETNTTQGASGYNWVYFDDILLYQPRCILSKRTTAFTKFDYAPAAFPVSGDCAVNYSELDIMMNNWLAADVVIEPTTNPALAGGLVAYYPMDEGTGTTTADASGNGNNGTFSASGVRWVLPGLIGNSAIDVNGAPGSRISIGTLDPVGPSGGFTLSLWAKWGGTGVTSQGLIGKRDGWGSNDVLRFMFEVFGNNQLRLGSYANSVYSQANVITPYMWRWAHISVTFDGTTATFYINDQDVGSGPFTLGTNAAATMTIGNTQSETSWGGSPEVFNGQLDEVRIYNRALSAAEIAYLADLTPADGKLHIPVQSSAELYNAEPQGSQRINFMDFAVLMGHWLEEQLWP